MISYLPRYCTNCGAANQPQAGFCFACGQALQALADTTPLSSAASGSLAPSHLHKQRNVLNAIPRRVRHEVETELLGVWAQPNKEGALTQLAAFKAKYGKLYPEAVSSLAEEEEHTLTFYDFPATMYRYIRTTNALESLFSNIRQRTDQIDVFTTKMSCLKPRDYLPDVVGTLTTGKLPIAEVGME